MEEAQAKLNETEFTGSANNDLVVVTLNGKTSSISNH